MNIHTVSVIIRTQDRPLLLRRALESLSKQTYEDWCAVIVNDGGPKEKNELIAPPSKQHLWIHNSNALGRTRAANQGIQHTKTPYVAFLDDDDTWEPQFLEKTVEFLNTHNPEGHYGAAAVWTTEIYEKVVGNSIVFQKKRPFRLNRQTITSCDLAKQNFLPMTCSLILRQAMEQVGLLDESLEYLEDWDLYLRLARYYQIGMITQPLNNYHFRTGVKYANTVTERRHHCLLSETYLRNKYLREDIATGKMGLGTMMNTAASLNNTGLLERLF